MSEIFINRRDAGNIPAFRFENGTARPPRYTLSMSGHDWQLALLESGTLYVLDTMLVDLFAVGGGQGGTNGGGSDANAGGNSGTTATVRRFRLDAGDRYEIIIGAGGIGGPARAETRKGGTTSMRILGPGVTTPTISAAGGAGYYDSYATTWREVICGSGGGRALRLPQGMPYGGRDGANGGGDSGCPGSGQTTRAFGEADGQRYAQGGCGSIHGSDVIPFQPANLTDGGGFGLVYHDIYDYLYPTDGAPNTGSGGGAGSAGSETFPTSAGNGGSGVLLIRNARR